MTHMSIMVTSVKHLPSLSLSLSLSLPLSSRPSAELQTIKHHSFTHTLTHSLTVLNSCLFLTWSPCCAVLQVLRSPRSVPAALTVPTVQRAPATVTTVTRTRTLCAARQNVPSATPRSSMHVSEKKSDYLSLLLLYKMQLGQS